MANKVIPIKSEALHSLPVPITGSVSEADGFIVDTRGRPLRDLRISVTDHCNFRCRYCMPKEKYDGHHQYLTHTELLSFEEILRLVRIYVSLGVKKIRLTGGEPLLRKNIADLISRLKLIHTPDGKAIDVAITTNATLLERMAQSLYDAGLDRVTVSLDALDEHKFQAINDVGFPAARVLAGIEKAVAVGLPVKVNTVVKRGMNEDEILPLIERFRGTKVILRFIEYMDAGTTNGWRMDDVIASAELVKRIHAVYPIEPVDPNYRGETASRWRFKDGQGEIGFISSVTEAFCRECSRARLSVEGAMVLCLFADRGFDLRTMLRGGATDQEIRDAISRIWSCRENHYSEIRLQGTHSARKRVEMQYIGG